MWLKLEHENLLPFYGAVEIDEQIYLVSPFMPRGSLRDYLQSGHAVDRFTMVR